VTSLKGPSLFCPHLLPEQMAPPFSRTMATASLNTAETGAVSASRSARPSCVSACTGRSPLLCRLAALSRNMRRIRGDARRCLTSFLSGLFHVLRLHASDSAASFVGRAEVGAWPLSQYRGWLADVALAPCPPPVAHRAAVGRCSRTCLWCSPGWRNLARMPACCVVAQAVSSGRHVLSSLLL
jgi:hypothetical protein